MLSCNSGFPGFGAFPRGNLGVRSFGGFVEDLGNAFVNLTNSVAPALARRLTDEVSPAPAGMMYQTNPDGSIKLVAIPTGSTVGQTIAGTASNIAASKWTVPLLLGAGALVLILVLKKK